MFRYVTINTAAPFLSMATVSTLKDAEMWLGVAAAEHMEEYGHSRMKDKTCLDGFKHLRGPKDVAQTSTSVLAVLVYIMSDPSTVTELKFWCARAFCARDSTAEAEMPAMLPCVLAELAKPVAGRSWLAHTVLAGVCYSAQHKILPPDAKPEVQRCAVRIVEELVGVEWRGGYYGTIMSNSCRLLTSLEPKSGPVAISGLLLGRVFSKVRYQSAALSLWLNYASMVLLVPEKTKDYALALPGVETALAWKSRGGNSENSQVVRNRKELEKLRDRLQAMATEARTAAAGASVGAAVGETGAVVSEAGTKVGSLGTPGSSTGMGDDDYAGLEASRPRKKV